MAVNDYLPAGTRKRTKSLLAILWKSVEWLGTALEIIFLKMVPSNVIEGGESENRGPGDRMCVVYSTANDVLKNSKIIRKYLDRSNLVSNASSR